MHTAIACFLAAAHIMMLESLQEAWNNGLTGPQLLKYWHKLMELTNVVHDHHKVFFVKVVKWADSISHFIFFQLSTLSILADESEGGEGQQADTLQFQSLHMVLQHVWALCHGGNQEPGEISFRCSSCKKDKHNVLWWSAWIGFALLDLSVSCAASAIINENVICLHGNQVEHLLLCSSSQQASVSYFACLHMSDWSNSAFFETQSGVGSTITPLYWSWLWPASNSHWQGGSKCTYGWDANHWVSLPIQKANVCISHL